MSLIRTLLSAIIYILFVKILTMKWSTHSSIHIANPMPILNINPPHPYEHQWSVPGSWLTNSKCASLCVVLTLTQQEGVSHLNYRTKFTWMGEHTVAVLAFIYVWIPLPMNWFGFIDGDYRQYCYIYDCGFDSVCLCCVNIYFVSEDVINFIQDAQYSCTQRSLDYVCSSVEDFSDITDSWDWEREPADWHNDTFIFGVSYKHKALEICIGNKTWGDIVSVFISYRSSIWCRVCAIIFTKNWNHTMMMTMMRTLPGGVTAEDWSK